MIAITEDNYESVVLGANVPVLLDVYADWCPPCRRIAPLIEELAVALEGKAIVAKLDSEVNPNLIARVGINSLPTFLVFNEGAEVHRMVGIQPREKLLERLGATNSAG